MSIGKFLYEIASESTILLLQPVKFWKKFKKDKDASDDVFTRLFVSGLFLIFLAIVIGDIIFESEYGLLLKDTLIKAGRRVLLLLLSFFASTFLMYEISRKFKIPVSFDTARKIIIYSMTPLVIVTIVTGIFPFLDLLGVIGFYSFYLAYIALITIYEIKPNRNVPYLVILMSCTFIAYVFIAFLLSKLTALIIY